MKISGFTTPIIKTLDNNVKTCSIKINHKKLGELSIDSENLWSWIVPNEYKTVITNIDKKELGYENFSINPEFKQIIGYRIETNKELRNSNFSIGELLRLHSIITMLENNIDKFEINSLESAVFFHAKYKFSPDLFIYGNSNNVLRNIVEYSQGYFEDIVKKAQELIKRSQNTKTTSQKNNFANEASSLANEYIERVLKTKDMYKIKPFTIGMPMELTKERIYKNKEFFNELFSKHKIDYEI